MPFGENKCQKKVLFSRVVHLAWNAFERVYRDSGVMHAAWLVNSITTSLERANSCFALEHGCQCTIKVKKHWAGWHAPWLEFWVVWSVGLVWFTAWPGNRLERLRLASQTAFCSSVPVKKPLQTRQNHKPNHKPLIFTAIKTTVSVPLGELIFEWPKRGGNYTEGGIVGSRALQKIEKLDRTPTFWQKKLHISIHTRVHIISMITYILFAL